MHCNHLLNKFPIWFGCKILWNSAPKHTFETGHYFSFTPSRLVLSFPKSCFSNTCLSGASLTHIFCFISFTQNMLCSVWENMTTSNGLSWNDMHFHIIWSHENTLVFTFLSKHFRGYEKQPRQIAKHESLSHVSWKYACLTTKRPDVL